MLIQDTIREVLPGTVAPLATKILEKCCLMIDHKLSSIAQLPTIPEEDPTVEMPPCTHLIAASTQTSSILPVDVPPKHGPSSYDVSYLGFGCFVQLFHLWRTDLNGHIGFVIEQLPEQRFGVFVLQINRNISIKETKLRVLPYN